jgi:hypothetical protein
MPWWSVEGALFSEMGVILFWDAIHMELLRGVFLKKRSMFKVGVSIQSRCICMAKSSVCPQTLQSKEVFIQRRHSI